MGKARVFGSYVEEEIGLLRNKVAGYGLDRNPPNQVGTTFLTSQVGLTPIEQSGLQIDRTKMPRAGGVFSGSVGFEVGTTRLDTGTNEIDLLKNSTGGENEKLFGDFVVILSSGTTGTLTSIIGASKDGMRIRLYGIQGNTITITHTAAATANTITCPNDQNFTWSDDEVVDIVYDITSAKWILIGGGGGGGVTFPIKPTVDDREDTWTGTQNIDLNSSTSHITKFTLDQNLTITLSNIPPDETQMEFEIELLQDSTGGWTVDFPTEVVEVIAIATGADELTIVTLRVNDGTNVHAITTLAGDISGGGGGGGANTALSNLAAVAINTALLPTSNDTIDLGENTTPKRFRDLFLHGNIRFGTGGDARNTEPTIWADASGDMVLNVDTPDTFFHSFGGTTRYRYTNTDADFNTATLSDVGIVSPTGTTVTDLGKDTNLWRDAWVSRLRFTTAVSIDFTTSVITINAGSGVQVDLRSNNASQMQLLSGGGVDVLANMNFPTGGNLDLNAGFLTIGVTAAATGEIRLKKFAEITWLDNAGTGFVQMNPDTLDIINISNTAGTGSLFVQKNYIMGESADPSPPADTGFLYCKDITGDTHLFFDNSTESPVDLSVGGVSGATIELDNLGTTAVNADILPDMDGVRNLGSTSLKWSGVFFNVWTLATGQTIRSTGGNIEIQTSTGADIIFKEATTQFFRCDGGENATIFSRDIEITAGDRLRANSATEIGIFVKNTTVSIGTEGSLGIPFTSTADPTDAAMNGFFGGFDGAIGITGATASIPRMQIRVNNNWSRADFVNSN